MLSDIKEKIKSYNAKITSSNRTWEKQLYHILRPRNKDNYPNIKRRFKEKFELKTLPKDQTKLTEKQRKWWKTEIVKQAGRTDGFAHVGGNAVDVDVSQLTEKEKRDLKTQIEKEEVYKVFPEFVQGSKSNYGVSLEKANVFHIFKTGKGKKKANTSEQEKKPINQDKMDYFFFKKRKTGIWV
ncbi:hypothetical protein CRP01_19005 [Flavilitoribacter nigricans DSM 23189 = NBRC 102662]|uniref:Uncharacterized protein n=2 Tax=Flavilitoribacter TaxID=2762562 RepID=A0A2D0N9A9_FLAN2|nr:hypothetical protein CRP01_19005 [Flavilitoribacter nigricans DSM 23189 = NBRC 102662]